MNYFITCYKFDVNDIRIPGWLFGLVKMDSAMIFPMEGVSYARTDTDTFVWDSDNPPVNILFSIFVTYAPVFITLTSASYFPVSGHQLDTSWNSKLSLCNRRMF